MKKTSAADDDILCCKKIARDFWIIGDALGGPLRNGYIDTLTAYDANIRTLAKAIALQESGGTHFWAGPNTTGTAFHLRYPLREARGGGGYGVMQLTDTALLNRDSIWNWKKNIDTAMARIKACYDAGVAHLATHPIGPPVVDGRMRRLEGYDRYNVKAVGVTSGHETLGLAL